MKVKDRFESLDLYEQSFLYHPHVWYESRVVGYIPPYVLGVGLVWVQVQHHFFSPLFSILAILLWVIGTALDYASTIVAIRLGERFDREGLEFPIHEACPFLPDRPTVRELFFSDLGLIINLLFIPIIYFLPGVGIGAGLIRLLTSLSNIRQKRRVEWILAQVGEGV